jgi:hexosaminidase
LAPERFPIAGLAAAALAAAVVTGGARAAEPSPVPISLSSTSPIVPAPAELVAGRGDFVVGAGAVVVAPAGDAAARADAAWLQGEVARDRGLELAVQDGGVGAIRLERVRDPALGPEGYRLEIGPAGVRVAAATDPGLFYGVVSLLQLLTPDDGASKGGAGGAVRLEAVQIADHPRFAWRGLMLDSARHMQSVGFIEALLDQMARYKLNTLHWHLTDDQGWRLEIKRYPRLAAVGGWRAARGADSGSPGGRYGGFYSQDQVRHLVAYAAARAITIVPEIEMPGHASAAILAYPELGLRPVDPRDLTDWGVLPNLYDPSERTLRFQEDVLTEVMALFPSRYIHVGGDEAIKDLWRSSPRVQAQIRALGLKDEDALQGWFTNRIGRFLVAHGRRMVGWDEILDGGLPADATVMSWRGIEGAVAAAKAGHDTVLAPGMPFYFDNRQSTATDEPPGRGLVIKLKDVYAYDPVPASLSPEQAGRVLGVQGTVFTEHVRTDAWVEHMAFPREIAVAEMAWSPPEQRNWDSFVARLPAALARDRALGLAPADSAFEVQAALDGDAEAGPITAMLAGQVGEVRYTLDGSEPTATATVYTAPISAKLGAVLAARAFVGGRAMGATMRVRLDAAALRMRDNHQLKLCRDGFALNLEDDAPAKGPRAVFLTDVTDGCWIWPQADLGHIGAIAAGVGQLAFNLQLGDDAIAASVRPAAGGRGVLQVRMDGCKGALIASLPTAPAEANPAVTTLSATIPARGGRHDLCFTFTHTAVDPMWALSWVRLEPEKTSK